MRLRNPLILEAWSQAYDLHVHGFHEHALDVESVASSLPVVEKLVEYTRQVLEEKRRSTQHRP